MAKLASRRIVLTGILDPVDQSRGHTSISVPGRCEWPQTLKVEDAIGTVCKIAVERKDMTTNYPVRECECYMTFQDSGQKVIVELGLHENLQEQVYQGTARILQMIGA